MLLNEFLKEHRKVANQADQLMAQDNRIERLEETVTELKTLCQTQTAELQRVIARLDSAQSAQRLVTNE